MDIIESPCVRNCCLGTDDICMGCFRSIDEITGWHALSNEEKKAILARTQVRKTGKIKSGIDRRL